MQPSLRELLWLERLKLETLKDMAGRVLAQARAAEAESDRLLLPPDSDVEVEPKQVIACWNAACGKCLTCRIRGRNGRTATE